MKTGPVTYALAIMTAIAVQLGTVPGPFAQEVVTDNDSGVGARAMGMGGAQAAAVNDITAIIHNPAALAKIPRLEAQLGLDLWKRSIDTSLASSRGNGTVTSDTDFSGLGTLGIAYPVPTRQGSLVFAAAYNRVKDFTGRFRAEGYSDILKGNYTGESIEDGGLGLFSFAGAVDISPEVSLGASIDVWSGNYQRDNRQLLNDPDEPYSTLDINGADDTITGVSVKPAFLYTKDALRIGGFVRLPMTYHIEEKNYDEGYVRDDGDYFQLYEFIDPSSDFNDIDSRDKLTYKIKAPMQFGFGLAFGNPGSTILAFDVNYENWKQAKIEYPVDYAAEPNYFLDKYKTAVSWKIGIEQPLFHNSVIRAGYMRHPLTFKGPRSYDSGSPVITVDNERDFLTFGVGSQLDRTFRLDAGYAHGFWSSKESPRTDKERRNSLYVAITYRSPD